MEWHTVGGVHSPELLTVNLTKSYNLVCGQ